MKDELNKLYKINELLRDTSSGLYFASLGEHYSRFVWIRDTYYQAKPNLKTNPEAYKQTYHSLLDYYKGLDVKYDNKVDWLISHPHPINSSRFIHPRFYPDLTEITSAWGNIQLDTFGYFFLGLSEGIKEGINIIRNQTDTNTVNKLIKILEAIKYWEVKDNGIWEEAEEVHASSIGAVLFGLKSLQSIGFNVPEHLFIEGYKVLEDLLPRESVSKEEESRIWQEAKNKGKA